MELRKRVRIWSVARRWLALATLATILGACGGDSGPTGGASELVDGDATVVIANSPGTLTTNGPQRVLVAVLGERPNEFLGSEDTPAVIELRSVDGSASGTAQADWLSPPTTNLGLYVFRYQFDRPGVWEVAIQGSDGAGAAVNVTTDSTVPEPGDPAPPSVTPTAASAGDLASISTDAEPAPRFYELSIADALRNGRPTVIAFATPAFCQTALCGPTLDVVKGIAPDHPEANFVHVEPFDIEAARAGALEPVAAMSEWGLATEPWVYVIAGDGTVAASFEGVIGPDELEAALAEL